MIHVQIYRSSWTWWWEVSKHLTGFRSLTWESIKSHAKSCHWVVTGRPCPQPEWEGESAWLTPSGVNDLGKLASPVGVLEDWCRQIESHQFVEESEPFRSGVCKNHMSPLLSLLGFFRLEKTFFLKNINLKKWFVVLVNLFYVTKLILNWVNNGTKVKILSEW